MVYATAHAVIHTNPGQQLAELKASWWRRSAAGALGGSAVPQDHVPGCSQIGLQARGVYFRCSTAALKNSPWHLIVSSSFSENPTRFTPKSFLYLTWNNSIGFFREVGRLI